MELCEECGKRPIDVENGCETLCEECYDYYFTGDVTDCMAGLPKP